MLQSSAPHRNVFHVVLLLQNEQLTHTSFPFHVYFNSGFNFRYFFQDHVSNYALATRSMVVFLTLTIMPLICSLKQQIFIEHTVHTEHFSGAGAVVENTTDNGLHSLWRRAYLVAVVQSLSRVRLSETPWTVLQTPQSRDSPSRNTAVGWRFLFQGIFPAQGLIPCLMHWQADSSPSEPPGKPREPTVPPEAQGRLRWNIWASTRASHNVMFQSCILRHVHIHRHTHFTDSSEEKYFLKKATFLIAVANKQK